MLHNVFNLKANRKEYFFCKKSNNIYFLFQHPNNEASAGEHDAEDGGVCQ